ncbi:hypothetical protein V5O48_008210 [Marasmius crinis-equi]|uniref:CxC2-like cysteine cluster KDZ transposase-associated domain-containing protein n=1 Tax=Marasmius crinis-equi TaxID=585013 RepID=A0ABR3FF31_9AGAR
MSRKEAIQVPAIRRWRFNQVNNRPNTTSSNAAIRTPTLSSDNRRLHDAYVSITPPVPRPTPVASSPAPRTPALDPALLNEFGESRWAPAWDYEPSSAFDDLPETEEVDLSDVEDDEREFEEEEEEANEESAPRKKYASDSPFNQLKLEATDMLKEIMRWEGRGDASEACAGGCEGDLPALYRCTTCKNRRLFCRECMVERHQDNPLDRIEEWNGLYFETTTLAKIGLTIQTGHAPGERCGYPRTARKGFVVVDLDFMQSVNLSYCGCQLPTSVGRPWQQLLRFRLFPATINTPHTAFTIRALKLLHNLTITGKLTTYHFYQSIESATDVAGITDSPKGRYDELARVLRMWRYLRALKRGGIANSLEPNLADVSAGSLAVICPACPDPKINLPDNWLEIVREKQYLHYKFLSVDACFRLKRRRVSSEQKDPGMITGKSYFVEQPAYQEQMELMKNAPEEKIDPHCTGHGLAAIEQAYTKFRKGYATTGCILCLCARHEIVEPNGVVDLDMGEKFWHTDYSISASQKHSDPRLTRVLSYDICCQYHIHFFERLTVVPEHIQIEIHSDRWRFVVPKLHIKGHGRPCQEKFAFHLLPGGGQTDGEGIERQWANLGPIGTSTREMGPGHRRDTIDDHISAWSWRKVVGLGALLRKRRAEARVQSEAHAKFFEEFTEGQQQAEEWLEMIQQWESGESSVNPFATSTRVLTEQEVRLNYGNQELESVASGNAFLHDVSPSAFMLFGLDLEDQQRVLMQDIKEENYNTVGQQSDLMSRRARIQRSIARFRALQKVYTPLALTGVASTAISSTPTAESVSLLLPSGLPPNLRNLPEMLSWVKMETEFRRAQCSSSLHGIRSQLLVQSRLHSQRSLHVRGQHSSTSARRSIGRQERKTLDFKLKYRAAWLALLSLLGRRELIGYRFLNDSDIQPLKEVDTDAARNTRKRRKVDSKPDSLIQSGESRRQLSWIWTGVDVSDDSKAMQEAMRIEWCKAYARKCRWSEELHLVEEEMRRTPLSLEYQALVWEARTVMETGSPQAEAINAYGHRQAALRRSIVAKFVHLWSLPDPPKRKLTRNVLPPIQEDSETESDSD